MKILIADDEEYTREGLMDSIDWNHLNIKDVMQARNGMEAFNISKWYKPDIVLTDIKMPKLDGIQFAKELVRINPFCKIIFMSGYMEIEYLKSAIQLSAVDYIEKPIDIECVTKAIKRASDEIQEKRQNLIISENRKELQQQKLVNVLIFKEYDKTGTEELCREVKFPTDGRFCCLAAYDRGKNSYPDEIVIKMQDFFRKNGVDSICGYEKENKYIIILSYKKGNRLNSLYQTFLMNFSGMVLGIGFESENLRNVYNSYQTAELALNLSFYNEKESLFYVDEEVLIHRSIEPGIFGEFMKILKEDPLDLKNWNDKLFDDLKMHKYFRREQVQTLLASLITEIYHQYPDLQESFTGSYNKDNINNLIHECGFLNEIRDIMSSLIDRLEEKYLKEQKYSRVIKGVLDYLAVNYSNPDLSITEVAEYMNFTSTYLNVLFKQEMKVTLKQYLSNYRLEKAKIMLENNFYKITDIAEKCGYANANYFAKVFKEMTNMTPMEYRNRRI